MTKLFVTLETGYCGEEARELIEVNYSLEELSNKVSKEAQEIDNLVHEMAYENYQMYGRDESDEDEFEDPTYSGHWEIYNPEEHNCYLHDSELKEEED